MNGWLSFAFFIVGSFIVLTAMAAICTKLAIFAGKKVDKLSISSGDFVEIDDSSKHSSKGSIMLITATDDRTLYGKIVSQGCDHGKMVSCLCEEVNIVDIKNIGTVCKT